MSRFCLVKVALKKCRDFDLSRFCPCQDIVRVEIMSCRDFVCVEIKCTNLSYLTSKGMVPILSNSSKFFTIVEYPQIRVSLLFAGQIKASPLSTWHRKHLFQSV